MKKKNFSILEQNKAHLTGITSIQDLPNPSQYLHEESLKEFASPWYLHQKPKHIGMENSSFFSVPIRAKQLSSSLRGQYTAY